MSRWLPHFYATETMLCFFDGEAEGWLIGMEWGCIFIEISVARRTRLVEDRHAD